MSRVYRFEAVIQAASRGGAYVAVPFDVEKAFAKKRVPIRAEIEGEPYRGTLVRMGAPHHILLVLKEIRQKTGKDIGDSVRVTLEEDLEPRAVEVPSDLAQALDQAPKAKVAFNGLSYTHCKEYAQWITGAKRKETRRRRIAKTIAALLAK